MEPKWSKNWFKMSSKKQHRKNIKNVPKIIKQWSQIITKINQKMIDPRRRLDFKNHQKITFRNAIFDRKVDHPHLTNQWKTISFISISWNCVFSFRRFYGQKIIKKRWQNLWTKKTCVCFIDFVIFFWWCFVRRTFEIKKHNFTKCLLN